MQLADIKKNGILKKIIVIGVKEVFVNARNSNPKTFKMRTYKLICPYCDRYTGLAIETKNIHGRRHIKYKIKNNTIQSGLDKRKLIQTFCNNKCIKNYDLVWKKIEKIEQIINALTGKELSK